MCKVNIIAAGALFLAFGTTTAFAAEPESLSLEVGGVKREALVYAPASVPASGGSPLVFVFHGHGGNMQNISRSMHTHTTWPEAIVVYPQGLNTPTRVDPEGKRPGWQRAPGDQGDRDLKFVDALLAAISKNYHVDKQRIYATGFSNGGVFTYVLWEARPEVFAAFAPCAGLPLPGRHVKGPKPAFIVAGEKDPLVPIANQRAMIEEVRRLDHAKSAGIALKDGAILYQSDAETPVAMLIHSGSHLLPREAPQLIVDFFREQQLKK